jgi:uncharacterized membrane protein
MMPVHVQQLMGVILLFVNVTQGTCYVYQHAAPVVRLSAPPPLLLAPRIKQQGTLWSTMQISKQIPKCMQLHKASNRNFHLHRH